MTHTLTLPFHTARLNELLSGRTWHKAHRLKKRDRQLVLMCARAQRIPPAVGKRCVSLLVTMGPRQRAPDGDAWWKSLADAMVSAQVLRDDNPKWCSFGSVSYNRGPSPSMTITLEDVDS